MRRKHVLGNPLWEDEADRDGGEVVELIEGLRQEGVEFTVTRHEAAAAFMGNAYGQATGRPGVCIATLGPGPTNLVTRAGRPVRRWAATPVARPQPWQAAGEVPDAPGRSPDRPERT